jgi:hypothetical protein
MRDAEKKCMLKTKNTVKPVLRGIKKVILEYIDFEVIVPNKCSKIRFSGNYFSTL